MKKKNFTHVVSLFGIVLSAALALTPASAAAAAWWTPNGADTQLSRVKRELPYYIIPLHDTTPNSSIPSENGDNGSGSGNEHDSNQGNQGGDAADPGNATSTAATDSSQGDEHAATSTPSDVTPNGGTGSDAGPSGLGRAYWMASTTPAIDVLGITLSRFRF